MLKEVAPRSVWAKGVKFDPQTGSNLHIELARSNSRKNNKPGSGPYVVRDNQTKSTTDAHRTSSDDGGNDDELNNLRSACARFSHEKYSSFFIDKASSLNQEFQQLHKIRILVVSQLRAEWTKLLYYTTRLSKHAGCSSTLVSGSGAAKKWLQS